MIIRLAVIISLFIFLNSCAKNKDEIYAPTQLSDPYKLYSEGLNAFTKNNFFFGK